MMSWKCGDAAHEHERIDEALACMFRSGRWWTIIESDKLEMGADVHVCHPRMEVPFSVTPEEMGVLTAARVAVIRDDGRKIGIAMKAMRQGEGTPVAAAAPRN